MNICVIGAGNIGTYLAAYISEKEGCNVWLHTSKKELFGENVELIEEEKSHRRKVIVHCISNDLDECVKDADYILITHPSFLVKDTLNKVLKSVKEGVVIGAIPGFGGKEYLIDSLLEKKCVFFGTQRVPSVVRLESYGKVVSLKQKNEFMKIRAIPGEYTEEVCEVMTRLIDIPCLPLKNYLGITLSPSNPTMHPSRLYELFKDYVKNEKVYDRNPFFYEEWGNEASTTLLELDEELINIFESLNENGDFSEEDFERIKNRFSDKPEEITKKIRSACGFQGIYSPMIKRGEDYIPDVESRYFTEDIQYGLCIIKAFAEICEVETPAVDRVIKWGQKLLEKEYIIHDKLAGRDYEELIIPQTKGIKNKAELIKYYSKKN